MDEKVIGLCPECADELFESRPHACWGTSPAARNDYRKALARDILLKLIEGQGDDRRCGRDTEGTSIYGPNIAKESVYLADALLAELAKPKEGA